MTSRLERVWYGDSLPARLARATLWPAELAYSSAVRLRGSLYDHGWLATHAPPLPVLAIGNVSVGGTGKTPVAAWAVARLRERGARPSVVLRGYGGDDNPFSSFQSWFGRPEGPSGLGFPRQGGPFYNDAGPGYRRPPFES